MHNRPARTGEGFPLTTDSRDDPLKGRRPGAPGQFSLFEILAIAAILSGAFMVVLDFFIVIVALPSIQRDLKATPAMLGLVVAAYAVATAAGLVAGGRLGDMLGRKRMFLLGLAGFTVASIGCGLARSPAELVVMRVLQGLAGASIQPQVLALLAVGFSGARRSRVFAWYAMSMGVAGVSAQVIGGLIIEADLGGLGWRGCFLINLPIGLAGLVLAALAVNETGRDPKRSMDLFGTGLVGVTLGLLVLALTYGRELGFPPWTWAALAVATAAAGVFVWHERRLHRVGGTPMLPVRLLAARGFAAGVLAVFIFYSAVASFYFVLGLHFQLALGLAPVVSGLMFAILGTAFFVSSMLGARIPVRRRSACMAGGAVLAALGHLWQVLADGGSPGLAWLVPGLLAEGAGIGLVMAPLVSAVLATAAKADAGVASGVLATVQQVGNALGVAFISAVHALGPAPAALSAFGLSMVYLIAVCLVLAGLLWWRRVDWEVHH